jgi:hypothetical protein
VLLACNEAVLGETAIEVTVEFVGELLVGGCWTTPTHPDKQTRMARKAETKVGTDLVPLRHEIIAICTPITVVSLWNATNRLPPLPEKNSLCKFTQQFESRQLTRRTG